MKNETLAVIVIGVAAISTAIMVSSMKAVHDKILSELNTIENEER